ncbi:helix-turn-helix domain-containing protein [Fibrobacter intestinalis]|uniref:helix-turn-helix domain-containing protein n=1 Tax=Fibrobacter TaxID=832 RepID=UPI0018E9D2C1
MSQEDFADATQLDRTYVSGLERGVRNPSYLTLLKIAKALHITLKELFWENG